MEENFKTEPDPFTTGGTVEEGKTTAIIAYITINRIDNCFYYEQR